MEGMHCTYYLQNGDLAEPKNICAASQCRVSVLSPAWLKQRASWLKKIYYQRESKLLQKYEACHFMHLLTSSWTVNNKDLDVFINEFGYS